MRFLVSATRSAVSHARLRQFLILACRVLAVSMLVLFLARPLAGGWLGWALSPAPDAILILLDRSASMEMRSGETTKRQQALRLLSQAARPFEGTSHLILIDSASRNPQELAHASSLNELSLTGPTDTAADIPAMLRTATDWLMDNRTGTAELWLATDGQRSNWLPDDARWKSVIAQLGGRSQKVRVRLLDLEQSTERNASVSITEMARRSAGAGAELQFVLELQRNKASAGPLPVSLTLNGQKSETEVPMDGNLMRWRHKISLGSRAESGGWGSFSLPSDANNRDNTAYFVYGGDAPLLALVVSEDPRVSRCVKYAAASAKAKPAELVAPGAFGSADLAARSLIIWQAPLPVGVDAARLQAFVASGGDVVFFPPGQADTGQFEGVGWGNLQSAANPEGYRVLRWEEAEGPLAKSDEHQSVPLEQASFLRRQVIVGQKTDLAAFDDGNSFLARQNLGKGEIYFCSTLPDDNWSSLADGPVLVPMLQRMLVAGSRRVQQNTSVNCGELPAADRTLPWVSVDSAIAKDIRTEAGVYRANGRLLAVNRPAAENDPEVLDAAEMRKLFGDLPVKMLQEQGFDSSQLQGEIWRAFLVTMLLFLTVEGLLMLPPRHRGAAPGERPRPIRRKEEMTA
jgi:hypothetical protein